MNKKKKEMKKKIEKQNKILRIMQKFKNSSIFKLCVI